MDNLDWTLTRSFLAVAETGSLSAAARQLGLSQPTLGRHIADLEAAFGLPLFTRQPRGLAPTAEAAALIPHARSMRDAAAKLALAVAGRDTSLHGPVRITASRIVSQLSSATDSGPTAPRRTRHRDRTFAHRCLG